ncbi:hypothetical protein H6B10_17925, partial [Gemmiger formicilis]|nr:hypothetical protein [Gemmiger formicilis]
VAFVRLGKTAVQFDPGGHRLVLQKLPCNAADPGGACRVRQLPDVMLCVTLLPQ